LLRRYAPRKDKVSQGGDVRDRLRPWQPLTHHADERADIVDYLDMVRIYLLTMLTVCEQA